MKMIKSLCVLILAGLPAICSTTAFADCNIGTSVFSLDTQVGDFRGVNVSGSCFYKGLVGARVSYMVGSEDETYQGVRLDLEEMYSADLIINLPLTDSFYPYLTAGNTWVEAQASAYGHSITVEDDYTTYGAGLHYDVRESVGVEVEYKNIDGDDLFGFRLVAQF